MIELSLRALRIAHQLAAPPRFGEPVERLYGLPPVNDPRVIRHYLDFWIHCAVQRRGGLFPPDGYAPLNHRGQPCRRWSNDYRRWLTQDANDLRAIAQRVRVYQFRTDIVRRRLAHLLSSHEN